MSNQILGVCPRCDAMIYDSELAIDYVSADRRVLLARCRDCRELVHPDDLVIPSIDGDD